MKTHWVVVAALALLVLMQPALLLIAAHYGIASSFQTAGELASLMGAIFTAGGLIVALVSLYTLTNVNRVVRDGVKAALESVPQQLDERIRTFLDAYTSFREAQELWDHHHFSALPQIEERLRRAEDIEPTLRDLRRWGGTVFYEAARGSYLREHAPDATYRDCPPRSERPALAVRALRRLEPEFAATSNGARTIVGLRVAQIYAMLGETPDVVARWIERAGTHGALPPLDGVNALTLSASCHSREEARRVLRAYGADIMDAEDILEALRAERDRPVQTFAVVVHSPQAEQSPPANPTVVTFRSVDKWNSAFIEWYVATQPYIGTLRAGIPEFPAFVTATGSQGNPPFAPLDSLLAEAMERLTFLAPYNFEPFVT